MDSINYRVRIGDSHLHPDQVIQIDTQLKAVLASKQSFLKHCYTLKQLADDTQIPLHHLSAFINQRYGMHFNDLINYYRVHHCKLKILDEEWKQKTLAAIGIESGFNNRNTFSTAFKKVIGLSPSVFLKSIQENNPLKKEEV